MVHTHVFCVAYTVPLTVSQSQAQATGTIFEYMV